MNIRLPIRVCKKHSIHICFWFIRVFALFMIGSGLGISVIHAQSTQPPDQAPATTSPNTQSETDVSTTNTQGFFDPQLAMGVTNTTSELPTELALGLGIASTATLLASAGNTISRGGQTTTPIPTQGQISRTSAASREQTAPPLVAQVSSVSALEEDENAEAEGEGGFSWPNWALPVIGFVTSQSQSFWQTLVHTGQQTIPHLPGFQLVVENGKVVLKWVVGGAVIAKTAIATVLASGIVLLWQEPLNVGEDEWLAEQARLREEEARRERERQQQETSSTPPAPRPQLPAEYPQWQADAQQFVQNVVNGAYSNSSQDYQAAVAYLQSLQALNNELTAVGLPPVTTQDFVDRVGGRLRAGRYVSQISYYIGQAEAGATVDLEMFQRLTNDAQLLSERMESNWPGMGFYSGDIRRLQLDWMRDLQDRNQYISQINDYIARAEAGETIDYDTFHQLTNDALYLSNQMETRWPGTGFYSSHERDNHLALVREFQIPDAPPTIPTEVPEPDTEPVPTNDPPEGEPPEEEPPNDPVPLPYIPDQLEPPTSTPVPDITAEQPSNSAPMHVPSPPLFPDQPGEDPIFIFTPIPGLEELLNGDNEPFIINPQPEEPIFVPNLIPNEPLPQLEPPPNTTPSNTPPIQASANGDQAGEHRPAPDDHNPGVEGPDGGAPHIGDEPEAVEQPQEDIDPDYGLDPLRRLRESAEAAADLTQRFWESQAGRILGAILGIGTSMTNPQQLPQPSVPDPFQPPAGPAQVEPPAPEPRPPYPAQPHQTIPQSPRKKPRNQEDDSDEPTTGPTPDPDPDPPITPEIIPDDVELPPMRPADPDTTFQMPGGATNPPRPALPPAPAPAGILTPAPAPGGPPALPPATSPNPPAPTSPPSSLPNNPQPGSTPQNALPPSQNQSAQPTTDPQQELRNILGDVPPVFKLASNDAQFGYAGAHTLDRHGPNIPLSSSNPNARTIESRVIDGRGTGWGTTQNFSYRWISESTANEVIDKHVVENWDEIRESLVQRGSYVATFDAGQLAGEGFYNQNAYVGGTRVAVPDQTSHVTIVIRLDPITQTIPYVHTSFPTYQPLSDSNHIIINDVDSP